jgi:hypothetical protein
MSGHKLPGGIGVSHKRPGRTVIKRPKIDHATRSALAKLLAQSIAYHDAGKHHLAQQSAERLIEVLKANAILGYST